MTAPAKASAAKGQKRRKLRKEEIVAEAMRLFAERGYEGASMGDLAERVGLRKASLFHHFPTKDALYGAVLARLVEDVERAIMIASTSEGSFVERMDALGDALTDTLGAQPFAARLLVREVMDDGPLIRGRLGRAVQDVLAAALEFAKLGQREGFVNPELDAKQAILTLVGVHFMPFAIDSLVERFTGTSPYSPAFLAERKAAVRAQVRLMMLARNENG